MRKGADITAPEAIEGGRKRISAQLTAETTVAVTQVREALPAWLKTISETALVDRLVQLGATAALIERGRLFEDARAGSETVLATTSEGEI